MRGHHAGAPELLGQVLHLGPFFFDLAHQQRQLVACARIDQGLLPVHRGYRLSDDDLLRREVITALMCHGRVEFAELEARHGIRFLDYFAESLASLDEHLADDLVQIHADALVLLPRGQLMMRSVAMAFDAYLGEGQSGRFSRTV